MTKTGNDRKHIINGSKKKIPKPRKAGDEHVIICKKYDPESGVRTLCIKNSRDTVFEEDIENLRAAKFVGKKVLDATSGGTSEFLNQVFGGSAAFGNLVADMI